MVVTSVLYKRECDNVVEVQASETDYEVLLLLDNSICSLIVTCKKLVREIATNYKSMVGYDEDYKDFLIYNIEEPRG